MSRRYPYIMYNHTSSSKYILINKSNEMHLKYLSI